MTLIWILGDLEAAVGEEVLERIDHESRFALDAKKHCVFDRANKPAMLRPSLFYRGCLCRSDILHICVVKKK